MKNNNLLNKIKTKIDSEMGKSSFLEINGNSEILLSGVKGITSYNDDSICVNTVLGKITVSGKDLSLSVYRGDIMSVDGTVSMIKIGE